MIRRGYIPVSLTDSGYLEERKREVGMNMPLCRCSSCDPQGAARIISLLPKTSIAELDELLSSYASEGEDTSVFDLPRTSRKRGLITNVPQVCKKDDPIRIDPLKIELAVSLEVHSERLFRQTYPEGCDMDPCDLFTREEVWSIVKNEAAVFEGQMLPSILGGEVLPELFKMIQKCISNWYQSKLYLEYQDGLIDKEVELEQRILNQGLLAAERLEKTRLKREQKRLKDIQAQAARVMRQEKAAERQNKRKAKENEQG